MHQGFNSRYLDKVMSSDLEYPLVSGLMPVYNGERFLAESIRSILNQTFAQFEFIIVDDGSNDKAPQILEESAARDPRLVLLQNPGNLSVARSLNRGLSTARGAYIARQDADDLSTSERLKVQVAYMVDHPDIGVLGTWAQAIDVLGTPGVSWCFRKIRCWHAGGCCSTFVSTIRR